MAHRRFHYDRAFEQYLREHGIPYVAVDEAKRALASAGKGMPGSSLKSFDFVVYSKSGPNLLVDVKGRKHSAKTGRSLQNWVTQQDIDSLQKWEKIFGDGFVGCFAFLFWCNAQPPDALFLEVFECDEKWYALLAAKLEDYLPHVRPRSQQWGTVSVPAKAFDQMTQPLNELL